MSGLLEVPLPHTYPSPLLNIVPEIKYFLIFIENIFVRYISTHLLLHVIH